MTKMANCSPANKKRTVQQRECGEPGGSPARCRKKLKKVKKVLAFL